MLLIAGISQLNGQAERQIIDFEINTWVECANDGIGENVQGWIKVIIVSNSKGFVAHPMGGYAVGDVTGTKFQAVGATIERGDSNEVGATTTSFVNRFHLVGKGTHFYIKGNFHAVMTPGGEWEVTLDKSELICK